MMEYFGLIIQEGKLSMDPVKLSGIRDWPTPNMVKQVQGFFGFANFYRWFIKKFSKLVLPLNNLLQKDTKFDWNHECQEAFETLKEQFLQEPVLIMPNLGKLEMYNAVKQHYGWPGLQIFVKKYVKGCGVCQQFKID
jgi:hypothetical protein